MGSLNILSLLVEINLQSFKKNKYKHIERYMLIMGTELNLRSKKKPSLRWAFMYYLFRMWYSINPSMGLLSTLPMVIPCFSSTSFNSSFK